MTKNVAVVGLDDFNRQYLTDNLRDAADIRFHGVLTREEVIIHDPSFPFAERLALGRRRLSAIPGGADGIITYWDFPSCALTPFLARDAGLPYAGVESVIKCEHKVWSREEEAKSVETPAFCPFYPFDDDPLADITLAYPFWIKPAIGHSSMLGFEIGNEREFAAALAEIRAHIRELTRPFRYVMENVDFPAHLAEKGASLCIAEEIISHGHQCTLEGYVRNGEVVVYGVVDSIRLENEHTFSRYQYPSRLGAGVVARMEDMTRRILRRFGYDRCPFNIEFFYNAEADRLHVLEVNSRISQSHSDMFLKVDGQPNQQIAVDLALAREPRWQRGGGEFPVAAKFFLRRFENARVAAVPDAENLRQLTREMPELRVDIKVAPGQYLSDLHEQESYSYEIADVFIGGRDEDELVDKFEACRRRLGFRFAPVESRRMQP